MRSARYRIASLAAATLAMVMGSASVADVAAPPERPTAHPSPAVTRAEFVALCEAFRQGDDPFFGRQLVDELQARLETDSANPQVRVGIRARLGLEWLRLGDNDRAVALLGEAQSLAAEAGLGDALRAQIDRDLALAHLRAAETENCVHHHAAGSCILPIAPEAIHRRPAHTRSAAEHLRAVLERDPNDVHSGWLLNLALMTAGEPERIPPSWRIPRAQLEGGRGPRWPDVAPVLGVATVDLAGGALMDDFDGDGRLDLITTTNDPCGPMRAFRNTGAGSFEDVSARWGLDAQWGGLNAVHADADGDGHLDILVLRGGWWGERGHIRNSLLRNDIQGPSGRFVDVTAAAGLAEPAYPTQTAAFADVDGDGDLDLYIGNEAAPDRPNPSQLFLNRVGEGPDGRLRFQDVSAASGLVHVGFTKGVAWGDADDDGDPDLYVSNIGPNRLWRNDGTEGGLRFTDVTAAAGVAEPAAASFATWFFDADQDGDLDLFVADYSAPFQAVSASYLRPDDPPAPGHPRLFRNDGADARGNPRFTDVSAAAGFSRPTLPMGANHGDLDNDGWPDIYLGTGVPDYQALIPNVMLRHTGSGLRYEDATFGGGFGHLQKGHGVAWGDVDDDGDQDLLHQLGGQYPGDSYGNALFVNPGSGGRWITLELTGTRANRFGVGARIAVDVVTAGQRPRTIHAMAGSGGSFGGSSMRQEIGLGDATAITRVVIRWPGSGTVQTFDTVLLDRAYRVYEDRGRMTPIERRATSLVGPAG